MRENAYFQEALANFSHEAASGGAIRHLADMGYTVKQIMEQLDFPTPYEKVQKGVWEHLVNSGVILLEEPGKDRQGKKAVYVREYDKYGKSTFRRVVDKEERETAICWIERQVEGDIGKLLSDKVKENGKADSFMSCDFGPISIESGQEYQAMLDSLNERQREYIAGLPWVRHRVYHRMDERMTEILLRLYQTGKYRGECWFWGIGERIKVV